MSVYIRFEPAGLLGVVPEGTYLIDAARRMGVTLPTDCRGAECTGCLVTITQGQSLLQLRPKVKRQFLVTRVWQWTKGWLVNTNSEFRRVVSRVLSAKEVDKTTAAEATKSAKELPLDISSSAVQAEC